MNIHIKILTKILAQTEFSSTFKRIIIKDGKIDQHMKTNQSETLHNKG
jgi:hypothetical protein